MADIEVTGEGNQVAGRDLVSLHVGRLHFHLHLSPRGVADDPAARADARLRPWRPWVLVVLVLIAAAGGWMAGANWHASQLGADAPYGVAGVAALYLAAMVWGFVVHIRAVGPGLDDASGGA